MNFKKIIPLLLCGTFLVTGCKDKVRNRNQKTKKDSLLTVDVIKKNADNAIFDFQYGEKAVGQIPSGDYTYVGNYSSSGFYEYKRNSDNKYVLYSFYKSAFLDEASEDYIPVEESGIVGGYAKIGSSVYDGTGTKIITLEHPDEYYYIENEFDEDTKKVTVTFFDGKLRQIEYTPGSTPTELEVDERMGSIEDTLFSLEDYGHKDYSINYVGLEAQIFEKEKLVKKINVPEEGGADAIIGDRLYYIINTMMPSTEKKDFDFIIDGPDDAVKYKQEIISVDYMNNKKYSIQSDYVIEDITPILDKEEKYTIGIMDAYELRKDKTINPNALRSFMVDEKLNIHEEITNLPFDILNDDVRVCTLDGKTHYLVDGYLYNSDFELVRDFSGFANMSFSKNREYIKASLGGSYGIMKLDGTVVVPFEFDRIYFDPGVSSTLYGYTGGTYFVLTKGADGKFAQTVDLTVADLMSTNNYVKIRFNSGINKLYSPEGQLLNEFATDETSVNVLSMTYFDAIDLRLINVSYTKSGATNYLAVKVNRTQIQ